MRLAVVSPFLDRQHGTEMCIVEQIERFARCDQWQIDLYSQKVEQVDGLVSQPAPSRSAKGDIVWHRVPEAFGPHLLKFVWWFVANQWQRRRDRISGRITSDLVYSPGVNCWDADVIVVHIVFHAFYERVKSQLALARVPLRSWPLVIHRRLYYRLIMSLEQTIYPDRKVRLVAVSKIVAEQLAKYFERKDVVVIPNAVDTLRFCPTARSTHRLEARQSFSFSSEDFVVLLIGNDWKKKGLDTLLRATSQLRNLPLSILVVGSDDPGIYRTMIEQLRLQNTVRFEKPSPDVLRFYSAADVYVGPSLEDAFNLPIVEAMSCGLPVIASVQAGASEHVRDGETGLLLHDPQDSGQLAHLVRLLYQDTALREKLGTAASCYVAENCGWDQNAQKTRDVLVDALKSCPRAG